MVFNAEGATVGNAGMENIHMVMDMMARSFFLTRLKENLRNLNRQKTILTLRDAIT
jgi:hypothetical protein